MSENKKECKKCLREYSGQSDICPYCGFDNSKPLEEKDESLEKDQTFWQKIFKDDVIYLRNSAALELTSKKHILLFLMGWLGIQFIALIIGIIAVACAPELSMVTIDDVATATDWYSAIVNFVSYGVLFLILLLILYKSLPMVIKSMKYKPWNYLIGVGCGVALIVFSILYSLVTESLGATSNDNQTEVVNLVTAYPIASLFILGVIGPICEELTYRLGLFSLLAKNSKVAAYAVSAILFGLIHFDFFAGSASAYLNEFINLPFYIISGVVFAIVYDKFGLQGSISMHITNNVVSVITAMI